MSQIGRELQLMLQAAFRESTTRRHAYLTVEHLLYALLHDARGAEILRHSGAQLPALKSALDRFFAEDLETVPGDEPYDAQQTLAFHRVLQHAVTHCESAEKEEVDAGDLLAALFQEPDSFAINLLRSQDVSRLDMLQYVSHGISKLSDSGVRGELRRPRESSPASATPPSCRPIRSRRFRRTSPNSPPQTNSIP